MCLPSRIYSLPSRCLFYEPSGMKDRADLYQLQQVPDFSHLRQGMAVTSFVVGSLN